MPGFDIKNYPLLKLALPLILGIAIGWQCNIDVLHIATLFAVSLLAVAAGFSSRLPAWLFGAGATGVMLAVGLFIVSFDKKDVAPLWSGDKVACEAQLMENPYMGGAATRALAYVVACEARAGVRSEWVVELYFANSVEAESLRVGEKISFEAVIKNPANAGNPAEFDAARYMRVKGISGSLFLPVDGWRSLGMGDLSLSMRALALRNKILKMYEGLGFEGDALSLLAAFSVGETTLLTTPTPSFPAKRLKSSASPPTSPTNRNSDWSSRDTAISAVPMSTTAPSASVEPMLSVPLLPPAVSTMPI